MGRDEILGFLEAVDAELVKHAKEGETVALYLIGRSALILRYGLNLATKTSSRCRRGCRRSWAAISAARRTSRARGASPAKATGAPRLGRDGTEAVPREGP
jgi:hypothetical protein